MSQILELQERFALAKNASKSLATATTIQKNTALAALAKALEDNVAEIVEANALDIKAGKENGLTEALLDRLLLNEERVLALAAAVTDVINLPDPVGEVIRGSTLANGIKLTQVKVPFGLIGAIYEARPNVTVDIAAIALKSGNGAILRGGTAAENTNEVLVKLIQTAISGAGLPGDAYQTVDDYGREGADALMRARGFIDVLIPRGSAQLISTVVQKSTVPVIETGAGLVHVYVDATAQKDMAVEIVANAKTHRPGVCNAAETILVHEKAATEFLPEIIAALKSGGVEVYGDETVTSVQQEVQAANDETWETEHLALEVGIKVVKSLDEALAHIERYSTKHTDVIVTEDYESSERFVNEVDSAVVMVNASSRFTDGGEFGFGAEVGISTQKLHARGPMALSELTSSKWILRGNGQIRK